MFVLAWTGFFWRHRLLECPVLFRCLLLRMGEIFVITNTLDRIGTTTRLPSAIGRLPAIVRSIFFWRWGTTRRSPFEGQTKGKLSLLQYAPWRNFTNRFVCMRHQAQQVQQQQQQQRPLTRYLPVRGDGFDLRQHVETAGHQVELCPHVTLTSTSARGYLHKMGSRFKTWNKRWFVFDRTQRTFLYFTDKSETRKRSGAYFQVRHLNFILRPDSFLIITCFHF